MEELKPCPCGETPKELSISDAGQGGKWANVSGDCCGEWTIEFRTTYKALDSAECMRLAIEAWNESPRAALLPDSNKWVRQLPKKLIEIMVSSHAKFLRKAKEHSRSLEPWKDFGIDELFSRLEEEKDELGLAINTFLKYLSSEKDMKLSIEGVQDECLDVINFAWFIHQRASEFALPQPPEQEK